MEDELIAQQVPEQCTAMHQTLHTRIDEVKNVGEILHPKPLNPKPLNPTPLHPKPLPPEPLLLENDRLEHLEDDLGVSDLAIQFVTHPN